MDDVNVRRLSENYGFASGYMIIGHTLFELKDRKVVQSYDLKDGYVHEMVAEARQTANLDVSVPIYHDDRNNYVAHIVRKYGELITYSGIAAKKMAQNPKATCDI